MVPDDPTPHAGEIMQPPNRTIPQPKPGEEGDGLVADHADADAAQDESNLKVRPSLPAHTEPVGANAQKDEESHPAVRTGHGIADGIKSLRKQKG